jgi:hypothetical protein
MPMRLHPAKLLVLVLVLMETHVGIEAAMEGN